MDIKKIKKAEKEVNTIINEYSYINDIEDKMKLIVHELTRLLPEYDIKCNYENNPRHTIKSGYIFAKISNKLNENFINLMFLI